MEGGGTEEVKGITEIVMNETKTNLNKIKLIKLHIYLFKGVYFTYFPNKKIVPT